MDNLELYLTTRIEALDLLIRCNVISSSDYLVMERAVCQLQLDNIKQMRKAK